MAPRILAAFGPLAAAAAIAAAAGVAAPREAHAQGARAGQQNLLELGRSQYDDLRYEEAIQTLSAAIIRRGNTPAQEIQIYELLALSYLALNRNDEAEGAFRLMLARDPDHTLSTDLAPRVIEFFNGVKQRWDSEGRPGAPRQGEPQVAAAPASVQIEHRSPAQQQRNHAVDLNATLVDPGRRVNRLVLAYRQGNRGLFTRETAQPAGAPGAFHALIPAQAVRPPLVEYYFEALDQAGVPVQARGDAFAPLRVAVPAEGGVPAWGVGLIIGGAALVVATVVVVAIVVGTQSAPAHLNITPMPQP